jgi:hypothetical protein
MKQAITHLLVQLTMLGAWTGSAIAGNWDIPFHTSFMNNIVNTNPPVWAGGYNEMVTCISVLGTEVYLGTATDTEGGMSGVTRNPMAVGRI